MLSNLYKKRNIPSFNSPPYFEVLDDWFWRLAIVLVLWIRGVRDRSLLRASISACWLACSFNSSKYRTTERLRYS